MFASKARLRFAWAIDLWLGFTLWHCAIELAHLPELRSSWIWLLPVALLRILLAQIAATPGQRALSIDVHDRVAPHIVRHEDIFSLALGTLALVLGCITLMRATAGAAPIPLLFDVDDPVLQVAAQQILAILLVMTSVELYRLRQVGWWSAVLICLLVLLSGAINGQALDAYVGETLAQARIEEGLAVRPEEVAALESMVKPALLTSATLALVLLLTMHNQFFGTRESTADQTATA